MVKPKWGAGGVAGSQWQLSDMRNDDRQSLYDELKVNNIEATKGFIVAVEQCVRGYIASKELDAQRANKQEVNAALQQISSTANKLAGMLGKVDDRTRAIIRTRMRNTILPAMPIDDLRKYIETLSCLTADSAQVKSNIKTARLFFCKQLASAFRQHLNVEPTTTEGGMFENVAATILGTVEGGDPPDLHKYICEALSGGNKSA